MVEQRLVKGAKGKQLAGDQQGSTSRPAMASGR